MSDRIHLPTEFLPCVDDWVKLRIIADYLEERGQSDLAKHLRWTANEWEWRRGLRRHEVEEGMEVWARFSSSGWSWGVVLRKTPCHILVGFPNRRPRPWTGRQMQQADRAWWDVEPRGTWNTDRPWRKPPPRKGYGTGKNAALAAALCHEVPVVQLQPAAPGLFEELEREAGG